MAATQSIALVGCGARANYLFGNHPDWLGDDVRLAALYDTVPAAAEAFRQKHAPDCRICGSLDEILDDPSVSWVLVMTPNATHADIVVRCFDAGKNVFSEKPIAIDPDQCRRIRDARRRNSRRYMIGFTLRYSPFYRKIREIVASGFLGRPVSMEFNEIVPPEHGGHIVCCWRGRRCHTGFHLLEKCCHDIDIANFICADLPARIASFGGLNVFTPQNAGLMDDFQSPDGTPVFCAWPTARGRDPFRQFKDIVDNQVCIFEYRSGLRASFHTNICSALPERRFYLAGTRGTLSGDALTGVLRFRSFNEPVQTIDFGPHGSHAGGDRRLLRTLHDSIVSGSDADAAVLEGIQAAVVCFAADQAMTQRQVVELEPWWERIEADADGADLPEPEAIHA